MHPAIQVQADFVIDTLLTRNLAQEEFPIPGAYRTITVTPLFMTQKVYNICDRCGSFVSTKHDQETLGCQALQDLVAAHDANYVTQITPKILTDLKSLVRAQVVSSLIPVRDVYSTYPVNDLFYDFIHKNDPSRIQGMHTGIGKYFTAMYMHGFPADLLMYSPPSGILFTFVLLEGWYEKLIVFHRTIPEVPAGIEGIVGLKILYQWFLEATPAESFWKTWAKHPLAGSRDVFNKMSIGDRRKILTGITEAGSVTQTIQEHLRSATILAKI